MNQAQVLFLDILKYAIQGKKFDKDTSEYPWEQILYWAQLHKVLPMIFELICEFPDVHIYLNDESNDTDYSNGTFNSDLKNILLNYRMLAVATVTEQIIKQDQFLRLYDELREMGIEPCVVKGLVIKNLYPKPYHRPSVDEDIFIKEEDFPACHDFLIEKGIPLLKPMQKLEDHEVAYREKKGYIYVEVHKALFDPEAKAYGQLNRYFEKALENSRTEEVALLSEPDHQVRIRTMAPTDHMLFLILHAYKHFLYSGFGIRQVCDINMFAREYMEEIDWEYIGACLAENHALIFIRALWRIGAAWLGFDWPCTDDTQLLLDQSAKPVNVTDIDESLILRDILEGGLYGAASLTRLHSSNITLEAVADSLHHGAATKAGISYILKSVFLPYERLKSRYPFLRKMPFLLPVAWIIRISSYAIEVLHGKKGFSGVSESVKMGQKRIEMLKKYGMIK